MVKGGDAPPQKHFIHTQATHFTAIFFFYAYGTCTRGVETLVKI